MHVRGCVRGGASFSGASAPDKNSAHKCFFVTDVTAASFLCQFSLWRVTLGRTGNANVRRGECLTKQLINGRYNYVQLFYANC